MQSAILTINGHLNFFFSSIVDLTDDTNDSVTSTKPITETCSRQTDRDTLEQLESFNQVLAKIEANGISPECQEDLTSRDYEIIEEFSN